ncbi:MAG: tRNA (adenosine(37)-N6)-threonylcarbamoyltransferase complex dimerization subunit type 1 TsaB [Candidatus Planktophila sp.]
MTISLAIDTSTSRTIVGVLDGEKVLFESYSEGATDHGRAVSELVSQALANNPAPEQVIVGMGPGPFTGLRVGISFARTFALAREIPLIGVCSLDAILTGKSDYTVAIDARRKEIYWARYENGIRVAGPSVNKPDEVADFIINLYPSVAKLVERANTQNESEPFYLRRPDAVPTAERS